MLGLKVALKDAQGAMACLIEHDMIDHEYKYFKDSEFIFFPVKKKTFELKNICEFEYVDLDFKPSSRASGKDLKSILRDSLTEQELESLKRAYDAVGNIAILEIDDSLRPKEKIIAKALLESNSSIKTVLRKDAGHVGEFRTQKMKWLAGKRTKEAIHIENGIKLKLNVETVYFSPRLSTERKRISELVKPGEKILVMFSGCAPYPCVLSKNTKASEIVGVEINPEGHKYGFQNIALNKLNNITLHNADVNVFVPKLETKFDRILMPLPKSAGDFLDAALAVSKNGTIIHFYNFLHEDSFIDAEKMVDDACRKRGFTWKKLALVKCGQQSPRVFRVCLDFEVLN